MKIRGYLGWALLLVGCLPVRAEDPANEPSSPLPCMRLPEETARLDSPLHVYGGGALEVTLALEAPSETHVRITADLFQLASGSVAPLQSNVPVTSELVFKSRTYLQVACVLPSLPAVRSRTVMLLKLKASDTANFSVGRNLTLVVYPVAEPGAWKKNLDARMTRVGLQRVAVFGDGTALRRFLQWHKIAFEDLGQDWPGEPDAQTLYLGETRAPAPIHLPDAPGIRLALFKPKGDEPLPEGIYQTPVGDGGSFWKVTLPNLFATPGSHPDAEAAVEEILRLVLESRSSARPDSKSAPDSVFLP